MNAGVYKKDIKESKPENLNKINELLIKHSKRIATLEKIVFAKKNPLDLNNDGKVDKKDKSIAGKVLSHKK